MAPKAVTHSDLVSGFVFLRDGQLSYRADHSHCFAIVLKLGAVTEGAVLVAVLGEILLLLLLPVFIAVAVLQATSPQRLPSIAFRGLVELEQL